MAGFDPIVGDLSALERRVLLVSASAGTGKTWMITHLATRWLLEDERHDPSALLMVTFSRSAARELKSRLRGRVAEVGGILRGQITPADEWSKSLVALAQTDGERHRWLLARQADVLSRLDDVNARTIHSFAAMVGDRSGETATSGASIYDRAANETVTRAALADSERLHLLVEDPEDAGASGVLKAKVLRNRVRSTAAAAVSLGGLDAHDGGPSKALAELPEIDESDRRAQAELLLELVQEAEHRSAEMMRLEASVTFDAMISAVYWDAVRGGDRSTSALADTFGLVLIDEFQDTDSAQWAIFKEAFVGKVPVVIVGDPKQAIYTFRGGDVVIFQDLLGQEAGGDDLMLSHQLTRNYRSAPDMLGRLNALFLAGQHPAISAYFDGLSFQAEDIGLARGWSYSTPLQTATRSLTEIRYSPVAAGQEDVTGGRVIIRDLTEHVPLARLGPDGRRPSALPYERNPDGLASPDDTKALITEDLVGVVAGYRDEGVALDEIAVLVRTNTMADLICSALRKAGISAVTSKTEQVFKSRAALQLRCLLWVLSEPTNPRRGGLLGSTWFRHHDLESLPSLARTLETHGPGALCRRALDTATTRTILSSEDPERSWTDIDHLFELLAAAHSRGVTASVALAWLEAGMTSNEEDEEARDALARRVESDGGAVTIMTMHGAKGLEFEVVLIPSIESAPGGKDFADLDGVLSTPEGRVFDLGRLTAKKVGDDSSSALDEERQRTDEAARLIYVGLTRAKSEMVAWISDLDRHDYKGKGERSRISKTSLWRLLVESLLLAETSELDEIAAICAAAGAPCAPDIEVVRPEPLEVGSSALARGGRIEVSTTDVVERPFIDESLRRWSYSALQVHGSSPSAAEVDVESGSAGPAYDGGVFAEDVAGDATARRKLGSSLFGGHAGNIVGVAIHEVFERVVGVFDSGETDRLEAEVVEAYRRAGITLGDPAAVTAEFATILRHGLGAQLDELSLDDLTALGADRVANEMRFTLPLEGRGPKSDRLTAIARLVAEHDADGAYAGFFAELASAPEQAARLFQGFLTGSIDLVAQVGDPTSPRFVVLDYKSNLLKEATAYDPEQLVGEMSLSGYPLQGLLYSVALHRYLARRMPGYAPERNLGGICYYYVRGAALPRATAGDGLARWDIPADVVTGCSDILAGRREA